MTLIVVLNLVSGDIERVGFDLCCSNGFLGSKVHQKRGVAGTLMSSIVARKYVKDNQGRENDFQILLKSFSRCFLE
jgi:hypothetical protein